MDRCFVMMPFGGYFDGYYNGVIKPTLEEMDINPVRSDEIYGTRAVIEDIHEEIKKSDICIADVTGRNPNVSYELGLAHAMQKPVVIITQKFEDVPFDYRHLRIINYDPKENNWKQKFKSDIKNTIGEVSKEPSNHLPFDELSIYGDRELEKFAETAREHLRDIFIATADYDLDRTNKIYCDKDGNAIVNSHWKVYSRSPIYHLCHNVVTDKPGEIEVRNVLDKLNSRNLEYVVIDEGKIDKADNEGNYLSYFFLFDQFKKPEQRFEAETEVYAENYFDVDRLIGGDELMLGTQKVERGIHYERKHDLIHFPKIDSFEGLYAEYLNHPKPELSGTRVEAVETDDHFLIELKYEAEEPYQQATAAALRLPESV